MTEPAAERDGLGSIVISPLEAKCYPTLLITTSLSRVCRFPRDGEVRSRPYVVVDNS